ncbi:MAG: glycoside hydrolase [Herbinix sp.]|jgi:hypothetical protein|nr:glycoside hydrolase [Herbinix sp.]
MVEKLSRERVNGFLHAKGRTIVNGNEEEIILTGWGLGNWLLCEGYMWRSYGSERFDRPNRMEAVIQELTGSEYANQFWTRFRDNYIQKEDIELMAKLGYNSVRIPLNWRIFMEAEPGIIWKEEGFKLIDRCLDWCEKYKIYAFLDLHGAPGGQTGANIDDCIDNVPRLFIDSDSWQKGIQLWQKMAERYKDRWIVAGYDLLNEPIAPGNAERNFEHLVPRLEEYYDEAIAVIRRVDKKHLISIEGHHWATNPAIFHKKYDDNMVIHFHRYACMPDISAYELYMSLSEKLDTPLWLGETGENLVEWFTAMYPLSTSLGIGYNLWPWKKMSCFNSPCSVKIPEGWDKIIAYTKGGEHPGYQQAQETLNQYLENMKLENCDILDYVTQFVFRQPGCRVRATDFDELPGKGISYSGLRSDSNENIYRKQTGMKIVELYQPEKRRFAFDCQWDRLALELEAEEFAVYSIYDLSDINTVTIEYICKEDAVISIMQEDKLIIELWLTSHEEKQRTAKIPLLLAKESSVKIKVEKGKLLLDCICFD